MARKRKKRKAQDADVNDSAEVTVEETDEVTPETEPTESEIIAPEGEGTDDALQEDLQKQLRTRIVSTSVSIP